jgi:hypothetical protein
MMSTLELTAEMIAEAMARAEKVACSPGNRRCFALPGPVVEARKICTPKGRCLIGGTLSHDDPEGGRTRWDARPERESCPQDARGVGI